jgi:hypothetical protein
MPNRESFLRLEPNPGSLATFLYWQLAKHSLPLSRSSHLPPTLPPTLPPSCPFPPVPSPFPLLHPLSGNETTVSLLLGGI